MSFENIYRGLSGIRAISAVFVNFERYLSGQTRRHLSLGYLTKKTSAKPIVRQVRGYSVQLSAKHTRNVEAESVTNNGNKLNVVWKDGKVSSYHSVLLRFNCHCEQCRELSSNMGRFNVPEMPTSFTISGVQRLDNNRLRLHFKEDDHCTDISLPWLKENCYSKESLEEKRKAMKPKFNNETVPPELPYSEVAGSDEGLYRWLKSISENGLCVLKGSPTERNHLYKVIQWIGPVSRNLYGELYDVEVLQNPINAAYTNEALQYHMDLPQYESPPGIQFLHCLRFDDTISGGETTFVDLMQVADKFRQDHPEDFDILTKVPCPFNRIHATRDHPVDMTTFRPIICLNNDKEIISITWHTNLHGPLSVAEELVEPFYKAFQLFAKAIKNANPKIIRFQAGDLIAFNNMLLMTQRKENDIYREDTFKSTTMEAS